MRVAVVGGSIAGCTAAVELSRRGHEVVVFERSWGGLTGRGAGIGTPTETLDTLVDRDLVDPDIPRFEVSAYPFVSRRGADDWLGHTALRLPLRMALLNWGDLWTQLRKRVPPGVYVEGCAAVSVEQRGDVVELVDQAGEAGAFDLALFADGYRSRGRMKLCPGAELSYRGYVLWRGVLPEEELAEAGPLEDSLFRLHYKGLPGNAVFYFVPGADGSVERGSRWVNWACYVPVSPKELPGFLLDRAGQSREHSLPPGSMRPEEEKRLKALMSEHLPSYFGQIVERSHDSFAQPIYTATVPRYAEGRIALLGDAGSIAPPFTGSGVFKALMNAVELTEALGRGPIDEGLSHWSGEQARRGRALAALGRQMENAFVWNAPDFSGMSEEEARAWWSSSVTFPEEFSYVHHE